MCTCMQMFSSSCIFDNEYICTYLATKNVQSIRDELGGSEWENTDSEDDPQQICPKKVSKIATQCTFLNDVPFCKEKVKSAKGNRANSKEAIELCTL